MTFENDLQKFWFCPGCFAEIKLDYSGIWREDKTTLSKCPVCNHSLLDVPSERALWDVRYHVQRVHEALHPVGKEDKEE